MKYFIKFYQMIKARRKTRGFSAFLVKFDYYSAANTLWKLVDSNTSPTANVRFENGAI